MRGGWIRLCCLVTLCAFPSAQTAGPPPLPKLVTGSFPPQARDDIEAAARKTRAHATDAAPVGALAMVLHAWDQLETAHAAYQRAQALAPGTFDWAYLDAVVLQRLGRATDAADLLKRALALSPDYLPAGVKLAEALFDAGETQASAGLYGELARQPAAAPVAALGLGRLAAVARQHDAAVAHFQHAIALFPEFGAAHYGLAMSLRALGRRDGAAAALEKHRAFGARWPAIEDPALARVASLKDDPRVQLQQALRLADDGDVAGAIARHEAALAREPSLAQAHANLITLYGRAGNWAKAEEHYRAVLALGFNRDEAHYNYGVLLGMRQRWREAGAAYRDALAANPSHAQALNNLGQILEGEGKPDVAAEHYARAVQSQPGFRLARFNLARMHIARGRNDEAIVELEKTVEPRDAETPRYLFGLATAHVRAGRRDVGVKLATEARELALAHGQRELAAAIDQDLARLR